jgi:hypothetical protein
LDPSLLGTSPQPWPRRSDGAFLFALALVPLGDGPGTNEEIVRTSSNHRASMPGCGAGSQSDLVRKGIEPAQGRHQRAGHAKADPAESVVLTDILDRTSP